MISGNGDGVTINQSGINGNTSFNITVQGNLIGTGADGVTPLGNTRSGIDNNCPDNIIGGTGAVEGNVIAFNGQAGVHHRGSTVIGRKGIRFSPTAAWESIWISMDLP